MPKRRKTSKSIIYKGHLHLFWALLDSNDFRSLNGSALKLLIALGRQYNGYNNGDLCAAMSMMKEWGFNSNQTLTRARKELLAKDLIIQTKQGGLGIGPSLYALTWQPIDECNGKLDSAPTMSAPRSFKETEIARPTIGARNTDRQSTNRIS